MGSSRQEYWSGLPFPSPGDLPDPETDPGLLHCRQILYPLSHQGGSLTTLNALLDRLFSFSPQASGLFLGVGLHNACSPHSSSDGGTWDCLFLHDLSEAQPTAWVLPPTLGPREGWGTMASCLGP